MRHHVLAVVLALALAAPLVSGCDLFEKEEEGMKVTGVRSAEVLMVRVKKGGMTEADDYDGVRFQGLKGPLPSDPVYREAVAWLEKNVRGKHVRLDYGHAEHPAFTAGGERLAYVFDGDTFVNAELLRLGHAEYGEKYGPDKHLEILKAAEKEAKERGLGVHAR